MKKPTNIEELLEVGKGTRFLTDLATSINANGKPMPRGVYNLILSIRDCKLYSKGIKPTRYWKISDVKIYFGITGNANKLVEILESYLTLFKKP